MSQAITKDGLRWLVDDWIGAGRVVAGPSEVKPGLVQYARLANSAELVLDGFIHPANSIKDFFFPRHEPLYTYRIARRQVSLEDCEPPAMEQLIFARPCDAAALPVLDHVFNWDFRDDFYNLRRAASTVVSLACTRHDDECFCTTLGQGPSSEAGCDALLSELEGGQYQVRCLTAKGKSLFAGHTTLAEKSATPADGPAIRFRPPHIDFESPVWDEAALECLGCGACAYTCPTCHCFDIVDEGNSAGGIRAKNWDSCQFPLFTLHASGHNTRHSQAQRQRQRIYHKFHIYPKKFGPTLCTGCGNCTRNCPVGLGVLNVLKAIESYHAEHIPA